MVKCSEPIVVAHSGLAAKQYVGTRGRPATVTDKNCSGFGTVGCVEGERVGVGVKAGWAGFAGRARFVRRFWGGEQATGAQSGAM